MKALLTTFATLRLLNLSGAATIVVALGIVMIAFTVMPREPGLTAAEMAVVLLVIQAVVVVVSSLATGPELAQEGQAGWIELNRLTGLPPGELAMGYAIGMRTRGLVVIGIFAAAGLLPVLAGELEPALWVTAQLVMLTTFITFTAAMLWAGLSVWTGFGIAWGLCVLVGILSFAFESSESLVWHLAPWRYFLDTLGEGVGGVRATVSFFHIEVPALMMIVAVQAVATVAFARAAVRKFAQPDLPGLGIPSVLIVFAVGLAVQHGLIWHHYQGALTVRGAGGREVLSTVQGFAAFAAVVAVSVACLTRLRLRLAVQRRGRRSFAILLRSGLGPGLVIVGLGVLGLFSHAYLTWDEPGTAWVLTYAALNLLLTVMLTVLVIETASLLVGDAFRTIAWLVLGVIFLGPLFLSALVLDADVWLWSPLVLAVTIVGEGAGSGHRQLVESAIISHAVLVGLLFILWLGCWISTLGTRTEEPSPTSPQVIRGAGDPL